jgi:hypothetical protein
LKAKQFAADQKAKEEEKAKRAKEELEKADDWTPPSPATAIVPASTQREREVSIFVDSATLPDF